MGLNETVFNGNEKSNVVEVFNNEADEVLEDALPDEYEWNEDEIGELPDELTHVPGLLGELIDWVTDTSQKPIRVLSLGPAIVSMGGIVRQ